MLKNKFLYLVKIRIALANTIKIPRTIIMFMP